MSEPTFTNLMSIASGLEEKFEKLKKDFEASEQACKDLQQQNEELKKENEELKKQNEELKTKGAAFEKETTELIQYRETEHDTEIKSLEEQGKKAQEKFDLEKAHLESALRRYQKDIQDKESQASLKISGLKQSLKEKKELLDTVRSENASRIIYLENKIASYRGRIRDDSQLYQDLQRTASRLREDIDQEKTKNLLKDEAIDQLLAKSVENDSAINQLESELEKAQENVRLVLGAAETLQTRLKDVDSQLTQTITEFFAQYDHIRNLLRRNFRINNDGINLDRRYDFTKEFIRLSSIIRVNPLQSLLGNV